MVENPYRNLSEPSEPLTKRRCGLRSPATIARMIAWSGEPAYIADHIRQAAGSTALPLSVCPSGVEVELSNLYT